MDFFVWRLFVAHLPADGRTGRWGDEEELLALWCLQMLIFLIVDLSLGAKVDADSVAQDGFAVEHLAQVDCIFDCVEADDDATEGFEWREGVDGGMLVDGCSDALETGALEDFGSVEVGDEEGIARRCRLGEGGESGQVDGQ